MESRFSAYTVVITRAADRAEGLAAALKARGFNCLICPAICVEPAAIDERSRSILAQLQAGGFTWIVMSSPNAAVFLREMQRQGGFELEIPSATKIAVQGEGTAASLRVTYGRKADLVPAQAVAESLLAALTAVSISGRRVLLAAARETRDVLAVGLNQAGADVEKLIVYETKSAALSAEQVQSLSVLDPAHFIFTFFSPSALRGVMAALPEGGELLQNAKIVSIGPVTSRAVESAGLKVFAEAEEQSDAGLIRVLEERL